MVAIPLQAARAGAEPAPKSAFGIRAWLFVLILLVFAMVLVGGATRLTESGLSITEWDLVSGTLPPLTEAAWQAELARYMQTPQYALLNNGMSLADFKTIFWWEWAHRELGRFIGLVYIAGFLWIAIRRALPWRTIGVLALMGLLLGTQGLVGWIMVASGLKPGMTAVAPVKLMLHLTLACLFFASLIAMFVRLGGAAREPAGEGLRWWARLLVVAGFGQIALGALVAGHDAGLIYNTWPLMDGALVPSGLGRLDPLWMNFVDNLLTIQFDHRIGAYVLTLLVLGYAAAAWRAPGLRAGRPILMVGVVLAQVALGIMTLIHVVPLPLALGHQALALILLFVLVWNASALTRA